MLKSPMSKLVINKIYKLHQQNSHGIYYDKMLEICWNHSLIVSEIALQLATNIQKKYNLNIDFKLIEQGALIHDIGYYICFNNDYQRTVPYIQHGYLGYKLLKKEKFDEKIARFALIHTGVGIDNDIPISLEEEIVTYADGFHSKGHPKFNTYQEQRESLAKFNKGFEIILDRFKVKYGLPKLNTISKEYRSWHLEINNWLTSIKW